MGKGEIITDVFEQVPEINVQWSIWKSWKNLTVLSCGFLMLFTSYVSTQNLQSSLNSDHGLGVISLIYIYAALIFGCLFLPNAVIGFLGLKKTVICSMLMYSFYFGANFYPTFYTLIPTSVVLGLGGSTLWPAKCSYVAELARRTSKDSNESNVLLSRYFGVFFGIFQCAQIIGNVISYMVLKPSTVNHNSESQYNMCGSQYCDYVFVQNSSLLVRPSDQQVYTLFGIFTAVALCAAVLLSVCLDDIKDSDQNRTESSTKAIWKAILHLKNKNQLLMIPITIYSGLEQAYICSDFTKAFVTCNWGIHNVGYVMICFGVTNAIASFTFGYLSKLVGRTSLITLAVVFNVVCILTMMFLRSNSLSIYFAISGVWGAADAVWQSQINTHYGVLFANVKKEGYAHYRLWESLGFIIAFSYSPHLCINVQLYILLVSLLIGFLGYLPTENGFIRFICTLRKRN